MLSSQFRLKSKYCCILSGSHKNCQKVDDSASFAQRSIVSWLNRCCVALPTSLVVHLTSPRHTALYSSIRVYALHYLQN